jgi:hypothetical protein
MVEMVRQPRQTPLYQALPVGSTDRVDLAVPHAKLVGRLIEDVLHICDGHSILRKGRQDTVTSMTT